VTPAFRAGARERADEEVGVEVKARQKPSSSAFSLLISARGSLSEKSSKSLRMARARSCVYDRIGVRYELVE
jgi:hypothetical protein